MEKALCDEEYGLVPPGKDNSFDLPSCKECINGGGRRSYSGARKGKGGQRDTSPH